MTADQQRDAERLERYIRREQLVSVMNNTKWRELQTAMAGVRPAQPQYVVKDLQSTKPTRERDWTYHLGLYKSIEWVDIDPVYRERRGALLPDLEHDMTEQVIGLLRERSIPYELGPEYIRIYGYRRTGG